MVSSDTFGHFISKKSWNWCHLHNYASQRSDIPEKLYKQVHIILLGTLTYLSTVGFKCLLNLALPGLCWEVVFQPYFSPYLLKIKSFRSPKLAKNVYKAFQGKNRQNRQFWCKLMETFCVPRGTNLGVQSYPAQRCTHTKYGISSSKNGQNIPTEN